jgi:transposase
MTKRYRVDLTEDEREHLLTLLGKGKAPARELRRARTLLLADEGRADVDIAATLHTSVSTVERTRKRFVEDGFQAALTEHPRPGGRCKLDGKQEAFLVATTCSTPPEGRTRWTLQLLADRMVALGVVEGVSDTTVWRTLKKTTSSPGW